jgi:signal transduction histidine kinase/DNA-binding response OmpR family regulator
MAGNILRKRIARKILLGYVVSLAVLLVAGIVIPVLFWSYLGSAQAEYEEAIRATDHVLALRSAARNSENSLRGYVLYRDDDFRQQYQEAQDAFRDNSRDLSYFLDDQPNSVVRADLDAALRAYRQWRLKANRLIRSTDARPGFAPLPGAVLDVRSVQAFAPVDSAMEALEKRMDAFRTDLGERAKANNRLRLIIATTVPTAAVLLVVLIIRSNTLGITRPLENLTAATELLEQGAISRVLIEESGETADDEIGDLQKAFRRMARTIGQREAVLRAQNEAVGALNRRVEAVLNSTNDAIIMLDRGGGFSVVNARFAQLFGIDPDVLLDHTFSQAGPLLLSRFQDKEAVRRCFNEVINDPEAICDETMDIVEPMHRTLRFYSAPVRGGEDASDLLGRIFVFRDVTRESAVDRMKTEFVSTVSHELRTPLTAIKGYVDLMVSGQTGPVSEIQQEFLSLVQVSTRRLSALINDMLDVSRIESGRITLRQESVDYVPLVQETVRMMQNEAEQKQITLSVDIARPEPEAEAHIPPVIGDSDRITQVLVNLISNGIKYTPAGGTVTISVEYEDDFVTTCVADTGIGINSEDQSRLFQKFFRADNSTTREVGGTGLGLAITKAVLEKLNGSIWVESAPQQGSRFSFTLPTIETKRIENEPAALLPASDPDLPTITPAAPSAPRKLILSIDSDVSALRRLSVPLREGTFATSNAATYPEAMRRARALRPDLITVAFFSRGFNSLSLIRDLQSDPVVGRLPIALLLLRPVGAHDAEVESHVALLPKPLQPGMLAKIAGPVVDSSNTPFSTILAIGEAASTGALHHCFSAPLIKINHVDTIQEANQEISDPHLCLIIVDAEATQGADTEEILNILRSRNGMSRVPIIIVTDALISGKPVLPLLRFGSDTAPVSGLNTYIKAFLAQEARILSSV